MTTGRNWAHRAAASAAAAAVAAVAAMATVTPAAAGTGTWTIDASADPSFSNRFDGVACPDATHCWAAGFQQGAESPTQTLIEVWTGTTWTVQTSPNVNTDALQTNILNGITCVSTTDCWAVGAYYNPTLTRTQPLWERWKGTAWTAVTLDTPVAGDVQLASVSCVASNNCEAVGSDTFAWAATPYLTHWDGTNWTRQPVPDVGGRLGAVSCADASHCKAVGNDGASPSSPLILNYNGTIWSVDTPVTIATGGRLSGVSCPSPTYCWAVGRYDAPPTGTAQNLLESWNGTVWTLSTSFGDNNNGDVLQHNELDSVACTSATFCWAVGWYQPTGAPNRTLIDSWNGTAWTLVPGTPNAAVANDGDILSGVACGVTAPTTHCAAVGDYFPPDPTLALGITVTAATPTAIPTPVTGAPAPGPELPVGVLLVTGGALVGLGALAAHGRRRHHPVP